MHSLILFAMNAAALIILAAFGYLLNVSGTGFCLGFIAGFLTLAIGLRSKYGYWP